MDCIFPNAVHVDHKLKHDTEICAYPPHCFQQHFHWLGFLVKGLQCPVEAKEKRYNEKLMGIVLPYVICLPLLKFFIFFFLGFP